ncbi:MAG: DUF4388 domain-containing protein [Trueperaceae bacterium]|nr:DUF4388 domain-containing protein [Trueperaceae bacterium]
MDLQGQLSQGGLGNLLQYLAMNEVTGCLIIRQFQGTKGFIFFRQGKLVHAGLGQEGQAGVRLDIDAVAVLLSWGEGRFKFIPNLSAPIESQKLPLELVLLEASRRVDEAKRKGKFLLHEDCVLSAKEVRNDFKNLVLSVGALQLLTYLNGYDSLRDIAFKKHLRLEEVLSLAEELYTYDLIELASATVSPSFVHDLRSLLVNHMGPVGDLLIEDVLYDLNLPDKTIPQRLVHEVLNDLRSQVQHTGGQAWFDYETRKLCSKHGINVFS